MFVFCVLLDSIVSCLSNLSATGRRMALLLLTVSLCVVVVAVAVAVRVTKQFLYRTYVPMQHVCTKGGLRGWNFAGGSRHERESAEVRYFAACGSPSQRGPSGFGKGAFGEPCVEEREREREWRCKTGSDRLVCRGEAGLRGERGRVWPLGYDRIKSDDVFLYVPLLEETTAVSGTALVVQKSEGESSCGTTTKDRIKDGWMDGKRLCFCGHP